MFRKQLKATSRSGVLFAIFILISGVLNTSERAQATAGNCGTSATRIHTVQGSTSISPLLGNLVTVEGIVTGDFQDEAAGTHGDLDGFFVQEADPQTDGDPSTSEGLFIFDGAVPSLNVQPGDRVRVTGTVSENDMQTRLSALTSVLICENSQAIPAATLVSLPIGSLDDFEAFEGMHVTFSSLLIGHHFNFDRYGEISLTTDRLYQPTSVFDPGTTEQSDLQDLNWRSVITLDDGRDAQNPNPAIHPDGNIFDLNNLFRSGDRLTGVTGIMDSIRGLYRIQPTQAATHTELNLRTAQPDAVGGSLKVAAYNVLNYFNGDGMGGGFPAPRGAFTAEDFSRQRAKIISAIVAIDADIIGLMEIENDGYGAFSAIQDLVNGLNDETAPDTFDFIDPAVSALGPDVITNGLIYKPSRVTPVGNPAILDSSVDPQFLSPKNRPSLAQTFAENTSAEILTVAVNHFKSKGSPCDDVGDPDTGDGSARCNLTRTKAAQALIDWLVQDPTLSGDEDFLIIGDLNSQDKEDPIDVFTTSGFTDLLFSFKGEFEYSFLFDSQLGYLDYAISSPMLTPQVSCVTVWHINADEPDLIDFTTRFKEPAQDAIYAPDPYRSSDHDPVIVGLNLSDGLIFRSSFETDCPGP